MAILSEAAYCDEVSAGGALIQRSGPILYGEHWRAPFCAMFEINERRLRRMLSGAESVPAGLLHDVEIALRDHGNTLDALLAEFP